MKTPVVATSPAKKTPDIARIKKMYAALAKAALTAISKDSAGSVDASGKLHLYAERHADWLSAKAEADVKKNAAAARRFDSKFKKLEHLHNSFVCQRVNVDYYAKFDKLKSEASRMKLQNAFVKEFANALEANGIGDRLKPSS